jgi:hypothetical protein
MCECRCLILFDVVCFAQHTFLHTCVLHTLNSCISVIKHASIFHSFSELLYICSYQVWGLIIPIINFALCKPSFFINAYGNLLFEVSPKSLKSTSQAPYLQSTPCLLGFSGSFGGLCALEPLDRRSALRGLPAHVGILFGNQT